MTMNSSRRSFLKSTGLGFLALGLPPAFLVRAAKAQQLGKGKAMVVIFQRGAMDGLNAVIPFKDRAYYALRPSIAVQEPASGDDRVIDLDGFYGLHPALAPLKSIYDKSHLAIIHAAGSPDNTRSHFDAQDYMEIGTPGIKSTPDGWLNRVLLQTSNDRNPFQAVALTQRLPRILAGKAPAVTMTSIEEFRLRDSFLAPTLQRFYANVNDPILRQGGDNLFEAMRVLSTVEATLPPVAADGYPTGRFGDSLKQIS